MQMALTLAMELETSAAAGGGGVGGGGGAAGDIDYSHSQSTGRRERERMFEKVVTPSDVGKLNRLVVPKHFAERHLPLRGAAARSRGTELCFHDARGGPSPAAWRFRYSYWSSSQSYVMTKGWNRYVRDKRLAAGDTVTFYRDGARLFIDCQRRRRTRAVEQGAVPTVDVPVILAVPTTTVWHQQQQPPQGLVVFPAAGQHQLQQVDQEAVAMEAAAEEKEKEEEEEEEEEEEARRQRGRWLRLFGVNLLELRADPVLLDLQL